MTTGGVQWADKPEPRRFVQITSVRAGRPLTVIAAGPVVGAYAHYLDGSSRPCLGSPELCELCRIQKRRWKGFLPAYTTTRRKLIVEVTGGCLLHLPALSDASIRGHWILLTRSNQRPNSPLFANIVVERDRDLVVDSYDPRPSILNMWGVSADGTPPPPAS